MAEVSQADGTNEAQNDAAGEPIRMGWRGPIGLALVCASLVLYDSELSTRRALRAAVGASEQIVAACADAAHLYQQECDAQKWRTPLARLDRLSQWRGQWLRTLTALARAVPRNVYIKSIEGGPIRDETNDASVIVAFGTVDERGIALARAFLDQRLRRLPGVRAATLLPGGHTVGQADGRRFSFSVKLRIVPSLDRQEKR